MKKLITIITSIVLCMTMIPCIAFAGEGDGNEPANGEPVISDEIGDTNETDNLKAAPASTDGSMTLNKADGDSSGEDEPVVEPRNGWITDEDNVERYYENDAFVTGLKTIKGYTYYFDTTGKKCIGYIKVGSAVYMFNSDGKAYTGTGWIDSNTRYALGNGTVATGVRYISGKYYLFRDDNGARVTAGGFFTQPVSKNTYYITSGTVARGWKAIGNRAYYFYKGGAGIGAQAKNTTIGYLKIPACGYLGEAYALGIKKLNSTKWTLKQAYKNSYKIKYQGRWWRQKTAEKYALKGFKKKKGNCYVMASTFYIQAKLLGYNVRQIEGKVNGSHPHSWTQIKQNGKWYVYDPNFRNETKRNGWKIWYGKKGTWRYNRYHVFQN